VDSTPTLPQGGDSLNCHNRC